MSNGCVMPVRPGVPTHRACPIFLGQTNTKLTVYVGNIMGMLSEFKEFAVKGNMVDMAVGIIIGGAFGTIVKSLVSDVIMPPIGYVTGGLDFSNLALSLGKGMDGKEVLIKYGSFLNAVIAFLIVAFVLFLVIKGINRAKEAMETEKKEEEAAAPPKQEVLLEEIRDLLKEKA